MLGIWDATTTMCSHSKENAVVNLSRSSCKKYRYAALTQMYHVILCHFPFGYNHENNGGITTTGIRIFPWMRTWKDRGTLPWLVLFQWRINTDLQNGLWPKNQWSKHKVVHSTDPKLDGTPREKLLISITTKESPFLPDLFFFLYFPDDQAVADFRLKPIYGAVVV